MIAEPKLTILVLIQDAGTVLIYGTPRDAQATIRRADDWAEFDGPVADFAGGTVSTEVMVPKRAVVAIRAVSDAAVPLLLNQIAELAE
jgi:hypothetical protein